MVAQGPALDVSGGQQADHVVAVVGVFAAAGITATAFDALAHDVQPFVVVEATADYTRERHASALSHIATTAGRVPHQCDLAGGTAVGCGVLNGPAR